MAFILGVHLLFFKIFGGGVVENRPFLQKNHYFCQFLPHFWSFCQDTVQKDANKGFLRP